MQATTPLDPRVLDKMLPFWTTSFGNPHSRTHLYGWESEDAVEEARKSVAKLIGAFCVNQNTNQEQTVCTYWKGTSQHHSTFSML